MSGRRWAMYWAHGHSAEVEAFITPCNNCCMSAWLILTATLPTSPSGLRVKVWRALKATHCATLREGVYILPAHAPTAAALEALGATIREAGADAHLLAVPSRNDAQDATFHALFDRSEGYAEFKLAIKAVHKAWKPQKGQAAPSEADTRKALRQLDQQLQDLLAADFFPGTPAEQARSALQALRTEQARRWSSDEPVATQAAIPLLQAEDFQCRTWATRARPWVDRLATAWLISRFIDRAPTFVWLSHIRKLPKGALGFDFDGARFTHVGELVTFEVVAQSFGLADHTGVRRMAELVHVLDVGGVPLDEAPGLEMLVRGLQALHADDDAMLAAALPLLDTLMAGLMQPERGSPPPTPPRKPR
jgi:hypothetical protein